jgi:beta-alanine degradation protein BauB
MEYLDEKDRDAVKIAPHLHEVLFENDKVRVLKVDVKPGDKAALHWHPENISYVLSPGKIKFKKADGSTADTELASGQVRAGDAGLHAIENIGELEFRAIQVELKG